MFPKLYPFIYNDKNYLPVIVNTYIPGFYSQFRGEGQESLFLTKVPGDKTYKDSYTES